MFDLLKKRKKLVIISLFLVVFLLLIFSNSKNRKQLSSQPPVLEERGYIEVEDNPAPFFRFRSVGVGDKFLESTSSSLSENLNQTDTAKERKEILRENKKSAEHFYGNEVGKVIRERLSSPFNDVEVFNSFIKNPEDKLSKENLLDLARKYKTFSEELLLVSPPKDAVSLHLSYISSFSLLAEKIRNILSVKPNSKDYADKFEEYNNAAIEAAKAYLALVDFFDSKGVVFEESEPGSIFNKPF